MAPVNGTLREAFDRAGWAFDHVAVRWQRDAAIAAVHSRTVADDLARKLAQVRSAIMYKLARAAAGAET